MVSALDAALFVGVCPGQAQSAVEGAGCRSSGQELVHGAAATSPLLLHLLHIRFRIIPLCTLPTPGALVKQHFGHVGAKLLQTSIMVHVLGGEAWVRGEGEDGQGWWGLAGEGPGRFGGLGPQSHVGARHPRPCGLAARQSGLTPQLTVTHGPPSSLLPPCFPRDGAQ